jgi:hypothetical protein
LALNVLEDDNFLMDTPDYLDELMCLSNF